MKVEDGHTSLFQKRSANRSSWGSKYDSFIVNPNSPTSIGGHTIKPGPRCGFRPNVGSAAALRFASPICSPPRLFSSSAPRYPRSTTADPAEAGYIVPCRPLKHIGAGCRMRTRGRDRTMFKLTALPTAGMPRNVVASPRPLATPTPDSFPVSLPPRHPPRLRRRARARIPTLTWQACWRIKVNEALLDQGAVPATATLDAGHYS